MLFANIYHSTSLKIITEARQFTYFVFLFFRLTPALMLFTLLYTAYFQYWGSGPFWPKKSFDYQQCKNNWWRNLLYIQNFFPISEQVNFLLIKGTSLDAVIKIDVTVSSLNHTYQHDQRFV